MKEQLQPPYDLLLAAAHERYDLIGTEKTMPVNEPDDVAVALSQLDRRNRGNALEAGKSGHPATMAEIQKILETVKLAMLGKFVYQIMVPVF